MPTIPSYIDYTVHPPIERVRQEVTTSGPKGPGDIVLMTNADGSHPAVYVSLRSREVRGLVASDVVKLQRLEQIKS